MNTRRNFLAKLAALFVAPISAHQSFRWLQNEATRSAVQLYGRPRLVCVIDEAQSIPDSAFAKCLDAELDKIAESYVTIQNFTPRFPV